MNNIDRPWYILFGLWLISLFATFGSLFFSEVMEFVPCSLCWYQRIAMYPLVLIILAGLFPYKKEVVRFSLPLSVLGLIISVYHNLLQWEIIPETISPCVQGVPCSGKYIEYFGFVTIPFLSMLAFALITAGLIYINKLNNRIDNE